MALPKQALRAADPRSGQKHVALGHIHCQSAWRKEPAQPEEEKGEPKPTGGRTNPPGTPPGQEAHVHGTDWIVDVNLACHRRAHHQQQHAGPKGHLHAPTVSTLLSSHTRPPRPPCWRLSVSSVSLEKTQQTGERTCTLTEIPAGQKTRVVERAPNTSYGVQPVRMVRARLRKRDFSADC